MSLDEDTFRQLLDTVSRFVEERLIPLEAETGDNDLVADHIVDEMRALGLFGLSIPELMVGSA